MIGYLDGKIAKKWPRQILLEVQGVGYRVFVPEEIWEKSSLEEPLSLYIHTSVREDDISLYGFDTPESLQFFELLLTVTRVGPKLALDIMNVSLSKVQSAILKKDIAFLSSISGVGKKTAERVILELHDKISLESLDDLEEMKETKGREDVIEALIKLGYDRRHIGNVLRDCPDNIEKEEDIIKYFLKYA